MSQCDGVGETSWGSWTLRRADADLDTVVAEAAAVLPPQSRDPLVEMAGDYYQSLDAALAYDAPALLAEHFARYRYLLAELGPGVDRAELLRSLGDVLGRHVDPETRALVNTLVGQTVLIAGQRSPMALERLPVTTTEALVARLLTCVDDGEHDRARGEVVQALEDGCTPEVLLEEVLEPFHDVLVARQADAPVSRSESERRQEMMRTLLFSVVSPDLSFPMVTRHLLLTESPLPAGWRAGFPRMVFETAGWRVDGVPADACAESVTEAVEALDPQVVLVQAARAADLDDARERIAAVRAVTSTACVLALGRPFRAVPTLAARLGADAGCGGLAAAVVTAARLLQA
jgi:methanogenic corrinoid protein MtbC1